MNYEIRRLLETDGLEQALALDRDPFEQQTHKIDYGLVIRQLFSWAHESNRETEAAEMLRQAVERRCQDRSFSLLMLLRSYTVHANPDGSVLPLDHQELRDRCLPVIDGLDRSDPRWAVVGDTVVTDLLHRFPWEPEAQPSEDPSLWFIQRPKHD